MPEVEPGCTMAGIGRSSRLQGPPLVWVANGDGRLETKGTTALDYMDVLRSLAIADPAMTAHLAERDEFSPAILDPKTVAMARLAALVAIGGSLPTYSMLADEAIGAGATPEEIVEVLVMVIPTVGLPRAVSAAPNVAMALGYDVEDALE